MKLLINHVQPFNFFNLKGVAKGETEHFENCAKMAEHWYDSIGSEDSKDLTSRSLNRVSISQQCCSGQ